MNYFLLLHLVNALFWLFHIHIYACVHVQGHARDVHDRWSRGRWERHWKFYSKYTQKTPMQLATWMCSSSQTFWRHTLSLSLGLVIRDVAADCIYAHSEFKKLGALSSQKAWGREVGVKLVIVVYVPKPGLSVIPNDFRCIPHLS